ncbi:hypothetical protein VDF74_06625 [Xanthomonas campestris pv. raphani]|uniref:hypothetical protein n=1 Tax=Xanthomonas campestris TaxID=339 RepID=UPI002B22A440|nr:hypothetical protein [Xanthomonas campestris]MEA9738665.1 hypothetical protein [Xanthomonas campestris pv. raphani]
MNSPLYDLDEMVLQCRDDRAKSYIREAIASYRAGAFRASIVATWVAVCYDIMAKLHELALAGDAAAEKEVAELTRIRTTSDLRSALGFEKTIVSKARSPFELISPIEEIDLTRLLEDRNRCAHPSLVAEGEAYEPPGELARLHIRNAISSLLKHPPAQGKYALERLLSDVGSQFFPVRSADAQAWMADGALKNSRRSLIDNFVISLVKHVLLDQSDTQVDHRRHYAALNACRALHPQPWLEVLTSKLSPILRRVTDPKLERSVRFFSHCPDAWDYIDADTAQKIVNFVKELSSEEFYLVETALDITPLTAAAEQRISRSTADEIADIYWFTLPKVASKRLITLYLRSRSFEEANQIGAKLGTYASELTKDDALQIIKGGADNKEIKFSFNFGPLLTALKSRTPKIAELGDFDELLRRHKLLEQMPQPDV